MCRIFAVINPLYMREVAEVLGVPVPASGNELWVEIDPERFPTYMQAKNMPAINVGSRYEKIIHMA